MKQVGNQCKNLNDNYSIYIQIYLLGLITSIPVSIMFIFGYLTYRNIHGRRILGEQQADRQLVRMTLVEIILIVICITPFGIMNTYNLVTSGMSKDQNRLMIENLLVSKIIYK